MSHQWSRAKAESSFNVSLLSLSLPVGTAKFTDHHGKSRLPAPSIPISSNDDRNAPMLHINETLGYVALPRWVVHSKDV